MIRKSPLVAAAALAALGLVTPPLRAAEPPPQDLVKEIKSLQARIDELEAKQKVADEGSWEGQPRVGTEADAAATQPTASEAVIADSDARSDPLHLATDGGVTAGFTKNRFTIQDPAGNFSLKPQLHFKPRFAANYREDAKHDKTDEDFQSGFEIRRMKVGFDGNAFGPNLTYLFLWATDRNSGNLVLEEAWAKYAFTSGTLKNFSVKGGQFKDPFAHESLTSSKKLLAAERSLINDLFTGGDNFVQGVSVGWDDGQDGLPIRAEVAYTDGANATNQNFQDFPTTKANFGVAGRIEYLAFGKWASYEDFTTVGTSDSMLVLGAAVDLTEAGNNDALLHTVDVQYERGPLGLYGAYLGRAIEDLRVGTGSAAHDANAYDWGFIAQAAYMLNAHLEPFLRYDYIHFDRAGLSSSVQENEVHEITAGANYYFRSHNAKMTVDFTYLPNGTPFADSGGDILASDGEAEFVLRAQFQLLL